MTGGYRSFGAGRRLLAAVGAIGTLAVVGAFAGVGCSMKSAPPESPGYAPEGGVPSSVGAPPAADSLAAESAPDDPQAELDDAEREIDQLLGAGFATPPAEPAPGGDPSGMAEGAEDPCRTACRALSSMERAADRLCEIADDEARCEGARGRVQRARDRVTARCSACE